MASSLISSIPPSKLSATAANSAPSSPFFFLLFFFFQLLLFLLLLFPLLLIFLHLWPSSNWSPGLQAAQFLSEVRSFCGIQLAHLSRSHPNAFLHLWPSH